jgi:hypothetical protein
VAVAAVQAAITRDLHSLAPPRERGAVREVASVNDRNPD